VCGYNPQNPQPCEPQGASCNIPCPDGWQPPAGEPDLCCQTEANGVVECFSQATGWAGSQPPMGGGPVDAGAPGLDAGSAPFDAGAFDASLPDSGAVVCGGPNPIIDGGPCYCTESYGGHTYQMSCNIIDMCFCFVDSIQVSSFSSNAVTCNDFSQARQDWTNGCGFPGM